MDDQGRLRLGVELRDDQLGGAAMKACDVLAVLFFVLIIFSFAGGTLLGAVNYPTWRSLNPAEFPRLHQAVNRPITLFYVPFFFLCAAPLLSKLRILEVSGANTKKG